MARTPGSKNRFATRVWLQDQLATQNFDAIIEFVKLYRESAGDIKAKLLPMVWDYLYPKARPESADGETESMNLVPVVLTPEQEEKLMSAVVKAKGEK